LEIDNDRSCFPAGETFHFPIEVEENTPDTLVQLFGVAISGLIADRWQSEQRGDFGQCHERETNAARCINRTWRKKMEIENHD